ncbi:MAG: hypothetical protein ACODAQ_08535 [Phycisphaeraceae bacterium]
MVRKLHIDTPQPVAVEPRRLLSARCGPLPPDGGMVRRWRVRQVRRALREGSYDQERALDAALDKLAAALGVSLEE